MNESINYSRSRFTIDISAFPTRLDVNASMTPASLTIKIVFNIDGAGYLHYRV